MGVRAARNRMKIGGIVDMSTVDWYGNVSLVVFFSGCNFRCPFCQNSSLILADSGEEMGLDVFRSRLEKGLNFLDAVVLTGGEPTLQQEAVMEVASLVKEHDLKVMLDTNGSRPENLERILLERVVDRVALDVKAPLTAEEYGRVIGLKDRGGEMAKAVERTLELCSRHRVEVEARTTIVPTISDKPEFIRKIASDISGRYKVYYLQQYDNMGDVLDPQIKELKSPEREKMMQLAEIALSEGLKEVYIKTREKGLERVG